MSGQISSQKESNQIEEFSTNNNINLDKYTTESQFKPDLTDDERIEKVKENREKLSLVFAELNVENDLEKYTKQLETFRTTKIESLYESDLTDNERREKLKETRAKLSLVLDELNVENNLEKYTKQLETLRIIQTDTPHDLTDDERREKLKETRAKLSLVLDELNVENNLEKYTKQ
jgi:Mg2+ and Co2+ transporter CorA